MAGRRKFHRKRKENPMVVLGVEKRLIEQHYTAIQCKIKNGILYCYGEFKPVDTSSTYSYRIKYTAGRSPRVHVISPEIEYNDDIHMFPKDNSLCLYHKSDLTWSSTHHLFDTIIPWTHEWFLFYEIYMITGKWEHPYVSHKQSKEIF